MPSALSKLQYKVIRIPIIGPAIRSVVRFFSAQRFSDSESYWIQRYAKGGNSGQGSHDKFAQFKAEIINRFVEEKDITTVIEFGCGDGNQLLLADYPSYVGYDISPQALAHCQTLFASDTTKSFRSMQTYAGETAELTLSLDVIYHLIEDAVFDAYMQNLFNAATRYVIIYASNTNQQDDVVVAHVRHRRFTDWVEANKTDWQLTHHIPNRYPMRDDPTTGSFADFYIYTRSSSKA